MSERSDEIPLSPRPAAGGEGCAKERSDYANPIKIGYPPPYVEYLPPKLTEGKEWYVHYSVINPATGKMVRYRNKVNRPKTVKERG